MPKIDYDDYQKSVNQVTEDGKKLSVSQVKISDTQYFIKKENILFDFIDMDFGGQGIGVEIWISFLGEDFKMRCDIVPKEELDTYDIPDYLCYLLEEYKPCLECKQKFLSSICDEEYGIEFIPDDDNDFPEEIL